ncbi:MAG: tyrosine-type recombinase/integrase [Tabrizicola sp.]|nr:tyrosine-type recombinase/integrase [Tabrizicola sp.]
MTALAPSLASFLREHLPRERNASPHTVAAYANTFGLLLRYAADRLGRRPTDLAIEDLDPELILGFLTHVEQERGNTARSRNARFAAIRSFFRYLEYRVPVCLEQALRVRALPMKKTDKALIDYLTRDEVNALLAAPDPKTNIGLRDRAMLHLTYAAGLRVSELLALQIGDFSDRSLSMVRILGKGRRERVLPLWQVTRTVLRSWIAARPSVQVQELFVNRDGQPLSRDGFANRLGVHVAEAAKKRPTLSEKRVTPHVLRHSCAMHTLEATGDIRKVSLWLGHASLQSTEAYLRVDPAEKLAILAANAPPAVPKGKFRTPDKLLAMLAEIQTSR